MKSCSTKYKMPSQKTVYKKKVLNENYATSLYHLLSNGIEWDEGVRSRKGFTRKAKALRIGDIPEVDEAIGLALSSVTKTPYNVEFIYLNYYENGEMWTPNHSHAGTHQMVISLGCPRTLQVSKKDYLMENGDVILFGSAIHGIPKEPNVKEGRIAIATFMKPC